MTIYKIFIKDNYYKTVQLPSFLESTELLNYAYYSVEQRAYKTAVRKESVRTTRYLITDGVLSLIRGCESQ